MDRCSLPTPSGSVTKFGLCYPGAIRSRRYSSIFTLTSELIFRLRMCCWDWLPRLKKQILRSCLLSFRTRYVKCSGGLDYWIASERIDCSRPLTTACKIISRDTRRLVALEFRWAYCDFVSEKVPRSHIPRDRFPSMAVPTPGRSSRCGLCFP